MVVRHCLRLVSIVAAGQNRMVERETSDVRGEADSDLHTVSAILGCALGAGYGEVSVAELLLNVGSEGDLELPLVHAYAQIIH